MSDLDKKLDAVLDGEIKPALKRILLDHLRGLELDLKTNTLDVRFEDLHSAIRDTRKAQKLTQAELAELAGVSVSFLANFESSKSQNISLDTLKKIVHALGVKVCLR